MNALLVGVLAVFAVGGTFKGFVKSAFSLLSFIIAVLLAFSLTNVTSQVLVDRSVLEEQIEGGIMALAGNIDADFVEIKFSSPSEMLAFVKGKDVPMLAKSVIEKVVEGSTFAGEFTVGQILARPVYVLAMRVASFVLIWLISFLIMLIVQFFARKVLKFSFFKVTDRVFGFLLGVGTGVLVYFVITAVMIMLSHVMLSDFLIKKIEEGSLSSFFYHTYGDKIIEKFFTMF